MKAAIDRAIEHLKQDIERERWEEIEQTLGVRVLVAQPVDSNRPAAPQNRTQKPD